MSLSKWLSYRSMVFASSGLGETFCTCILSFRKKKKSVFEVQWSCVPAWKETTLWEAGYQEATRSCSSLKSVLHGIGKMFHVYPKAPNPNIADLIIEKKCVSKMLLVFWYFLVANHSHVWFRREDGCPNQPRFFLGWYESLTQKPELDWWF